MSFSELWISYHQTSRSSKPVTAQLVDLEFQNQKLADLEDVLDHLFRQGFIEAKYRSFAFWENHEGHRVQAGHVVEELLKAGFGKCPQTALRLIIADSPGYLWFSYYYLHKPFAPVVTQRVKLDGLETKCELVAHLTNYIFANGYLECKLRSRVYWQGAGGRKIEEYEPLERVLESGDGLTETTCLRLVIDTPVCHCASAPFKCEPVHCPLPPKSLPSPVCPVTPSTPKCSCH